MTKRRDGLLKSRKYRPTKSKGCQTKKKRHVEIDRERLAKISMGDPPAPYVDDTFIDDYDEWTDHYKGYIYKDNYANNYVYTRIGGCSSCGYPLTREEFEYRQSVMDYIDKAPERFTLQNEKVEITDNNVVYLTGVRKTDDELKEEMFKRIENNFIDDHMVGVTSTKKTTWTPWGRRFVTSNGL